MRVLFSTLAALLASVTAALALQVHGGGGGTFGGGNITCASGYTLIGADACRRTGALLHETLGGGTGCNSQTFAGVPADADGIDIEVKMTPLSANVAGTFAGDSIFFWRTSTCTAGTDYAQARFEITEHSAVSPAGSDLGVISHYLMYVPVPTTGTIYYTRNTGEANGGARATVAIMGYHATP